MHASPAGEVGLVGDAGQPGDFIPVDEHGVNRTKGAGGSGIAGVVDVHAKRIDD